MDKEIPKIKIGDTIVECKCLKPLRAVISEITDTHITANREDGQVWTTPIKFYKIRWDVPAC